MSTYIRSVAQLDILLILFECRDRSWSIEQLRRASRTNDEVVSQLLKDLAIFVKADNEDPALYRFTEHNSEAIKIVKRVAITYQSVRYAVISEIHGRGSR